MRVADQWKFFFNKSKNSIMRYFADYMKETVYAINKDGTGFAKFFYHEELKLVEITGRKEQPWLNEENGVGFLVEEITKNDYESFAVSWKWAKFPSGDKNEPLWKQCSTSM